MKIRRVVVSVALLAWSGAIASAQASEPTPTFGNEFVLSPEGNHLWAYDVRTGEAQLVVRGVNAGDPGVDAPAGSDRRDINGQICVSPDGGHVLTGEDTVFAVGSGGDGGSSHDPRIAGWGYYEITGDEIGSIELRQVGKLAPEAGEGPGYAGDPDNYGCGWLDSDRAFTTALGDTLPGQPANGQLFLWFGPFDAGYDGVEVDGAGFLVGTVDHCAIDSTLATTGGIDIDANGDVYVATNRPDDSGNPGAVWRYSGTWPTSLAECTPEYLAANITKELLVPPVPAPVNPVSPTPSAVVVSPAGTLYVSSVFTGTVSEWTRDGVFVRDIYPASPVAPRTGPTGNTPFGLAFDSQGSLWIADIGIVGAGPASGQGSLVRVTFDALGNPAPGGEVIADGLTFPDGLGIYRPGSSALVPSSSEWGCDDWGMYGRTLSRQFSTSPECPSVISPETVGLLQPVWTFRVPAEVGDQSTFTASPVVVDGVVYIGGWNGRMYALDADDGSILWQYEVQDATGATYGPIVSSAAVADVDTAAGVRRLVIFGSGPILYALDADPGARDRLVWTVDISNGLEVTSAEFQSSPLVYDGVVYVGSDVHNKPGTQTNGVRGGMHAFDAATGASTWSYFPEVEAGQEASGCGGVWGSPVLDTETGLLYFGTANCPAVSRNPALPTEEITALVAATGRPVWTFRPHQPPGQASYDDDDEDFGATPNLYIDADGRKILGAGSKDGSYYALDPATGALIWNTTVTEPAPGVGGFIGSPAVWNGSIFGGTAIGTLPAYHSFDGATGAVRWQGTNAPTYAPSAVTNGVVFIGALDFTFRALDADTGAVLWAAPMPGAVSSGAAIAGDLVIVGSGTSTSDACAKDNPTDAACVAAFDALLGQQGAIHAYRLPAENAVPG